MVCTSFFLQQVGLGGSCWCDPNVFQYEIRTCMSIEKSCREWGFVEVQHHLLVANLDNYRFCLWTEFAESQTGTWSLFIMLKVLTQRAMMHLPRTTPNQILGFHHEHDFQPTTGSDSPKWVQLQTIASTVLFFPKNLSLIQKRHILTVGDKTSSYYVLLGTSQSFLCIWFFIITIWASIWSCVSHLPRWWEWWHACFSKTMAPPFESP